VTTSRVEGFTYVEVDRRPIWRPAVKKTKALTRCLTRRGAPSFSARKRSAEGIGVAQMPEMTPIATTTRTAFRDSEREFGRD
jgi:hypothetical protein